MVQVRPLRAKLVAVALAAAAGGCGAPRPADDEIVVLIEQAPGDLDPRLAMTSYGVKIGHLVTAPLVSLESASSDLVMELAESVRQENATTYLVRLREARFSDGRPVGARDVRWTIESTLDPATKSPYRSSYGRIGSIDLLDDRTLRLRLTEPHAPFVTDLDLGIVPEGHGAGDPPVGAGPFRLVSHDESGVVLERNEHYFRGPVAPRRVTIRVIRDDNSRLLALVGGSADLAQNTVPPPLVDAVAKNPRVRVTSAASNSLTYLGMNLDDPALRDARVRRAIALAIDRERIVRAKLGGRARLATGMLGPDHWAYDGGVARWPFDPARARRLLDEAGLRDPDGDGPEPRLRLTYKTSSNRFRVALARVLARMLADVGIEAEVRSYEFATFFDDVKKGNFQIVTMQVTEVGEPQYLHRFFHSSSVPTPERPDAGNNRWRYRNARLDELLDEGRRAPDRESRRRAYAEAQRILADDLPLVPLYHEDNVVVAGRRVRGFAPLPNARFTALWRTTKSGE